MEFCTVEDLVDNLTERTLIQLTDDNAPPAAVNIDRCRTAIAEATETILGRLAGRYAAPDGIKPTPLLRRICIDICAYYLYSRRNKGDIENIRKRYEEAIKELEFIKLGQVHPPQPDNAAMPAEYRSNKRKSSRMFSDDVWEKF